MKKKFILASIIIICFTSMSFRGCPVLYLGPHGFGAFVWALNAGFTNYPPGGGDNVGMYYSISVGDNGRIARTQGTNNYVFNQIPSGTTQRLNNVGLTKHIYQNDAAIVGNNGTVLVSSNTGLNWTIKTPVSSANLYGVDHNNIFLHAVGDNGTILYSSNMITGNLEIRTSGTTRNLKAVTMSLPNPQQVVVVGEKGTILRTIDGGFNWVNVSIPDTTFNFNALSKNSIYYFTDIFVAAGSGGRIYKSTDVGATWQQKPSGTTNTLRSIYFASPDSGVVVGDNGTIRFTTNGGETWFTDAFFNSPSTRQYRSVTFLNRENKTYSALSDTMFFVSDEPFTVGITQLSNETPNSFSLSQNYPNPFNPTTNIEFAIPKSSFVKLIVYDMLGREVETLVNENLSAGTYNADWSAEGGAGNYSSGVYFYKLISADYSETKRMVLIK